MTHFEKNEGESSPVMDNHSESKPHEHKVHKVHENHQPHAHHKKEHHEKEKCCSSKGLSNFQKFLAIAVIVQIVLLLFIIVKLPSGGVAVNQDEGGSPTAAAVADARPSAPSAVVDMESLIDDDAVEGDPDAPVTIIEWSDYECPFCARFYSDTLQQLRTEYIETGKAKLVFRDFPLSFHQNAQKAAEAAECAGEQDKYYEMHDLLFEQGVSGGVTAFKSYAQRIGLDTAEFNSCLDSGEMAGEVRKDFSDGQQAGITGTPGFIVNGKLISGAQPFQAFAAAIDAELN